MDRKSKKALATGRDWSALQSLRIRARLAADGYLGGQHVSRQRGAGLEFAGHRAYCQGDDLRWLDQRAVLRQDRLLIKQFETETDRHVELVVDASASMGFSSGGETKYQHASLLAASLARVAVRSGDRVGLQILAGEGAQALAPATGNQAFERVLETLNATRPSGQLSPSTDELEQTLARVAQRSRRGSLLVLLSDLLELPPTAARTIAGVGVAGRQLLLIQVLDPLEASFAMDGSVRLKSNETAVEVETNATVVRNAYLRNLKSRQTDFKDATRAHGGDFVVATTETDPVLTLRSALRRVARGLSQ